MIYPKVLEELIESFKTLPGIGDKSAERLALTILKQSQDEIDHFALSMQNAKKKLHNCKTCGFITDEEECIICSNPVRNKNKICVVEDYKSVFMFEKMGKYDGVYQVLNGLISPIDGIGPDDINIDSLIKKCKENKSKDLEVVIALKPSIEGETTIQYINILLKKYKVKVSRLSYGIPVGTEIDYLDSLTLERAFEDRRNISE